MSNPGVVTLETLELSPGVAVKLEDNLGESVHIHVGALRLDLTLKELTTLSDNAEILLDEYLQQFGLSVKNFDRTFLGEIGHMLIDLETAAFVEVSVANLLVTRKRGRLGRRIVTPISDSDVIRAMDSDFEGYSKTFGLDAAQAMARVRRAQEIITSGRYGDTREHIVVFNDQMFIRDGQHRAAAIFKEDPVAKIKVLRLSFRGNRHSIPKALWLAALGNLRPSHLRRFVGRVRRAMAHAYRRMSSKLNRLRNILVNGIGS